MLQDEAFGDFVARVGFMALRQYAQGYVPADKSGSLASVSAGTYVHACTAFAKLGLQADAAGVYCARKKHL